jgi:biopolymer transport protein ExbB
MLRIALMVMLLGGLVVILTRSAAAQDAPAPATAPAATATPAEGETGAATTLYKKLVQGGWTVGVQLIVSVAGLAFVIERFINLRKPNVAPAGLFERVDALWSQGRVEQIDAVCEQHPSTLGRMIQGVVAHRHGPAADAATVAGDIGARELKLHLQKAYPIAVVATIEPLLGLFGTVWGMILAFDKVAMMGTMGNASALSNEIAIALVTTAVGLAIAIPMLALHHYFKSRTAIFGIALEEQVSELISRHLMKTTGKDERRAMSEERTAVSDPR